MPYSPAIKVQQSYEQSVRTNRVSIGLPVYNGELTVGRALETLLSQTFSNFELIISDNASTDNTFDVCREFSKRDSRIRYFRQNHNIGAHANFEFVLQQANSDLFMWAAADDRWRPTFIEKNAEIVLANPNIVGSISKVYMPGLKGQSSVHKGTNPIRGDYLGRLRQYLYNPGANSRFYGLFRRHQIARSYVNAGFGSDWAIMINLLAYGGFCEVDEFLMERSSAGASRNLITQFQAINARRVLRILPLYDFTVWLMHNLRKQDFVYCADLILRLNIIYALLAWRDQFRNEVAKWTAEPSPKDS